MARNIAISTARTIVYKEHGVPSAVERKREVLSLRFYVSYQGEAALASVCVWVYSGSKWVGHERLWIIARNEFRSASHGDEKVWREKIYPRVMEMTRGTALGERIYREEKNFFPSTGGFLLPAWFQIPDFNIVQPV